MHESTAFENIEAIKIESPADKLIIQLKNMILTGQLKPGDRLPAERILAEKFGIGRGYIREAILKLEFYGLLKTSPQSGTHVSSFSGKILDRIFTDIVNFNKEDYASLVEARYYLEKNASKLAAERRNEDDIVQMRAALAEFDSKTKDGMEAFPEDLHFHIKIAGSSKNSVLESMIINLVPDIIKLKNLLGLDIEKERNFTIAQHHKILDAIINKDVPAAGEAMTEHLRVIFENRFNLK